MANLMNNPALLGALQERLGSLVGQDSGYLQTLPTSVHRRIAALHNLQDEHSELQAQFRQEVLALEKKYHGLHGPLYEKRAKIIAGDHEPTDEEAKSEEPIEGQEGAPEVTGIPRFWLNALRTHPQIADLITEQDEVALEALTDIKLSYLADNPGFQLEFIFGPNDFFTNTSLTKTYYLAEDDDGESDDLLYDHAVGTKIDWKEGKNLAVKVETKKQRHKATNKTRVVKKEVRQDTFFNFFSPPTAEDEEESDQDEEEEGLDSKLEADYAYGEMIKDDIVPNAVKWFTGEALHDFDEDDYSEDYGSDEDEDDDEDEDEESDDDDAPPARGAGRGRGGPPGQRPECKQQ